MRYIIYITDIYNNDGRLVSILPIEPCVLCAVLFCRQTLHFPGCIQWRSNQRELPQEAVPNSITSLGRAFHQFVFSDPIYISVSAAVASAGTASASASAAGAASVAEESGLVLQ